jgi:hypothetical protein
MGEAGSKKGAMQDPPESVAEIKNCWVGILSRIRAKHVRRRRARLYVGIMTGVPHRLARSPKSASRDNDNDRQFANDLSVAIGRRVVHKRGSFWTLAPSPRS